MAAVAATSDGNLILSWQSSLLQRVVYVDRRLGECLSSSAFSCCFSSLALISMTTAIISGVHYGGGIKHLVKEGRKGKTFF
jgi:hypothetical protein